jgi:Flp pilus assembly pilin Flp
MTMREYAIVLTFIAIVMVMLMSGPAAGEPIVDEKIFTECYDVAKSVDDAFPGAAWARLSGPPPSGLSVESWERWKSTSTLRERQAVVGLYAIADRNEQVAECYLAVLMGRARRRAAP